MKIFCRRLFDEAKLLEVDLDIFTSHEWEESFCRYYRRTALMELESGNLDRHLKNKHFYSCKHEYLTLYT